MTVTSALRIKTKVEQKIIAALTAGGVKTFSLLNYSLLEFDTAGLQLVAADVDGTHPIRRHRSLPNRLTRN
jgi:hypothetical protein